MSACQLVSIQALADGVALGFQTATPDPVAGAIDHFFVAQGYRLESGSPMNGVYGRGNEVLRILFGAFAKRYKFNVSIAPQGPTLWLTVRKGMSGAMGGVIGHHKMTKESERILATVQAYFRQPPFCAPAPQA